MDDLGLENFDRKMTKEQSEEIHRKRLERFGPVEQNPPPTGDGEQKDKNASLAKLKS